MKVRQPPREDRFNNVVLPVPVSPSSNMNPH